MYDFYSDTKSKPTRAMLEAMIAAEVGDEQKGEDPTTNALCERVADELGQEAAVFLPSGTMCNEIAIRVHCRPGDEVISDQTSHIINFEGGGPAALSGVVLKGLPGERGIFSPDDVKAAVRPPNRYAPRSRLVSVEQTANLGGGKVWPQHDMATVVTAAHDAGLLTHMDGARLFNACVKAGVSARAYTSQFDSCWVDFTKGLGAPVGAVLAGSRGFIGEAWRFKQQWGGAMRQSGVIAAACLYALDHHVDRLADDHGLAATIGTHLQGLPKVESVLPVETNIVIFDIAAGGPTGQGLVDTLEKDGIVIGAFAERRVRIVTHIGVGEDAGRDLCAGLSRHLG